jgi:hypothetical protein
VAQVEETRRLQFASFAEALELSLYDFQGAMVSPSIYIYIYNISPWERVVVVVLTARKGSCSRPIACVM